VASGYRIGHHCYRLYTPFNVNFGIWQMFTNLKQFFHVMPRVYKVQLVQSNVISYNKNGYCYHSFIVIKNTITLSDVDIPFPFALVRDDSDL